MNNPTKHQNYKNHRHLVPLYHYVTFTAMLVLIAGSIYNITLVHDRAKLFAWLFFLLVCTVISVSVHARSFALKAQDRAIRAEENLRYFILTGKRLPQSINIYQVIALRFAGDEELEALATRTVKENLTPNQIKQAIKNWRADYHRA